MSGERRKPKPSGSTSSTPSPKMLSPFLGLVLQQREDQLLLAQAVGIFDFVGSGHFEELADMVVLSSERHERELRMAEARHGAVAAGRYLAGVGCGNLNRHLESRTGGTALLSLLCRAVAGFQGQINAIKDCCQ